MDGFRQTAGILAQRGWAGQTLHRRRRIASTSNAAPECGFADATTPAAGRPKWRSKGWPMSSGRTILAQS
jgi:hypothetical protein